MPAMGFPRALALTADDRAYVASALEQSLTAGDGPQIAEADQTPDPLPENGELAAELQRRSAAFRHGATTSRSAEEVLADMRRRQFAERSK